MDGRRTPQGPEDRQNDRFDARAVAAFVVLEGDSLSPVALEDDTAILRLLANERESAVGEANRLRNQLHALLHHADPEYDQKLPRLTSTAAITALMNYAPSVDSAIARERAGAVRRLAARLMMVMSDVKAVSARIRELAAVRYTPLTKMCGVNLLWLVSWPENWGPETDSPTTLSSLHLQALHPLRLRQPARRGIDSAAAGTGE